MCGTNYYPIFFALEQKNQKNKNISERAPWHTKHKSQLYCFYQVDSHRHCVGGHILHVRQFLKGVSRLTYIRSHLNMYCTRTCKWGFSQNVNPLRWDSGKNHILRSVYLTRSHRIFTSQWPSSKIAMGSQTFTGQVPLQTHETFSKNTSCMIIFQKPAGGDLWESFVFLEGGLTCEPFRSHRNWVKRVIAMGKCDGIL